MKNIKTANQRGLVKQDFQSILQVKCLCSLCDFDARCDRECSFPQVKKHQAFWFPGVFLVEGGVGMEMFSVIELPY